MEEEALSIGKCCWKEYPFCGTYLGPIPRSPPGICKVSCIADGSARIYLHRLPGTHTSQLQAPWYCYLPIDLQSLDTILPSTQDPGHMPSEQKRRKGGKFECALSCIEEDIVAWQSTHLGDRQRSSLSYVWRHICSTLFDCHEDDLLNALSEWVIVSEGC